MRAEPLGPVRAELGEGPVWAPEEGRLHWLDVLGQARHVTDPETGETQTHPLPRLTSCLARRQGGGWVAAGGQALHAVEEGQDGPRLAALPEGTYGRFNDGKCDAAGRLWIGTANAEGRFDCHLYRIPPGGAPERVVDGIAMSNGLGWSPDGRVMYYADSTAQALYAFDFEVGTGALTNQRRLFETTGDEVPDGLSVDAEGHVWLALWGGGRLVRLTPAGEVAAEVHFPTPRVSSCAFGGAGLETLFVTTAKEGASEEERAADPMMGALFRLDPGIAGLPVAMFGG
ncbi:SMP-30/gluconolactonase/LRE family protein [Pseudoroseicyclus tamaricis]|uniref:SMP-30/gluconolactonase/LRE family protein n=1 Tax=Pseudoroseicyclus tamaricis TaxID=2705421 RepID=A0A6B2K1L9_9RHOB|nr:SMP-30/gluconolactonase/LRE family protein [Pseudoroseicyclus tamaricis]NDV00266.1 SMP-30/gluconolactonase/LRE family protein [Pseudoroseicyclus tamaricis]